MRETIPDKYAGACWNALMEEETKESIAEMLMDGMEERRELKARNKVLEEALDWVARAYKRTLAGRPVRNADEILSCADAALREDR